VYAFARVADDFADEGNAAPELRLQQLAEWRVQLNSAIMNEARYDHNPVFLALGDTIRRFSIPPQLFHDLLDAFAQDVTVEEYDTFEAVLDYCSRSANPIGRIMLALFGVLNERTTPLSDALCTGLQLANFWQDVSIDIRKPRIYLPKETREKFGIEREQLRRNLATTNVRDAIRFEVQRTRGYFRESESLPRRLPFRLGVQVRATWHGGMRILDLIERQKYDVLLSRPKLHGADVAWIFFRVFFGGK
jgi:squalene synthase HpnC